MGLGKRCKELALLSGEPGHRARAGRIWERLPSLYDRSGRCLPLGADIDGSLQLAAGGGASYAMELELLCVTALRRRTWSSAYRMVTRR